MGDRKSQKSGIPVFQKRGSQNKIDIPSTDKAKESCDSEPARPPPSPPIDIPGRACRVQSEDEEVSMTVS